MEEPVHILRIINVYIVVPTAIMGTINQKLRCSYKIYIISTIEVLNENLNND